MLDCQLDWDNGALSHTAPIDATDHDKENRFGWGHPPACDARNAKGFLQGLPGAINLS